MQGRGCRPFGNRQANRRTSESRLECRFHDLSVSGEDPLTSPAYTDCFLPNPGCFVLFPGSPFEHEHLDVRDVQNCVSVSIDATWSANRAKNAGTRRGTAVRCATTAPPAA